MIYMSNLDTAMKVSGFFFFSPRANEFSSLDGYAVLIDNWQADCKRITKKHLRFPRGDSIMQQPEVI